MYLEWKGDKQDILVTEVNNVTKKQMQRELAKEKQSKYNNLKEKAMRQAIINDNLREQWEKDDAVNFISVLDKRVERCDRRIKEFEDFIAIIPK